MPLYEYRCRSCERTFEVLQKLDDRPLRKCRECSGRLDKLVSRTSFQLRGGGWYADGYGRGSSSDSKPKSGSPSSSASASSSSDKSGSGSGGSSGGSSDKST